MDKTEKSKLKNRIIITSIFLVIWSLIVDSTHKKGGVDHYMLYVIFLVILGISYLYFSIVDNLILVEKIVYSFLFSVLSFIIGEAITGSILEKIYGIDYEIFASTEIANLIFYFLTNLLLIGIAMLFLKYKK
jgi:hypothetical protein